MKSLARALMILSTVFSLSAQADIVGKRKGETDFIKITKTESGLIVLETCPIADKNTCRLLGDRAYTPGELEKVRDSLKRDSRLKAAGATAAVVVGIPLAATAFSLAGGAGFGVFAEAVLGTTEAATAGAAIWGMLAGGASGISVVVYNAHKYLNPVRPYRAAKAIENVDQEQATSLKIQVLADLIDRALSEVPENPLLKTADEAPISGLAMP